MGGLGLILNTRQHCPVLLFFSYNALIISRSTINTWEIFWGKLAGEYTRTPQKYEISYKERLI